MPRRIWVGWKPWAKAYDLPDPEPEFRFSEERRYRLDCAWPQWKLGIEVHGGLGSYLPSHMSYKNRRRDIDKVLLAQRLGWRVLEFEWKDIFSGSAVELIRDVLKRQMEAVH